MDERIRRAIVIALNARVAEIERNPGLTETVDWMIEACGLTPSTDLRKLALLSAVVTSMATDL